jgi:cyclase
LISEVARKFGSQCMVLSIEAKQVGPGRWEAYADNGRERTGLDVVDWARRGVQLGAGEILIVTPQHGVARGATHAGGD